MSVSCDPNTLAAASNSAGFCCLPPVVQWEVQTYLLSQMAQILVPNIATDPNTLAQAAIAAGFSKLSPTTLAEVQVYLLCQLAQVSGV